MNRLFYRGVLLLSCTFLLAFVGCSGVGDSSVSEADVGHVVDDDKPPFDPTAPRIPSPSKSLTLSPDWQPLPVTRTAPARMKPRVQPSRQYGAPTRFISSSPSDAELLGVSFLPEPLRPVPGTSSEEETRALASALRSTAFDESGDLSSLRQFLENYPTSRWAPSLQLNLGSIAYGTGYFEGALAHWKAAWQSARILEDPVSQQIANQGLAEYAKMNARLGRTTELKAIASEAEGRDFTGDALVKMQSALEGLWVMNNRPGVAFRCGPYALANVATKLNPDASSKASALLERVQSPREGFSLSAVHAMASGLGAKLQMAKRERPEASIIVPAVVHWRVGHFGALMRAQNGSFFRQRSNIWKRYVVEP